MGSEMCIRDRSKHEMHAAELSDEVESKVQANAVCDCDGLLATN